MDIGVDTHKQTHVLVAIDEAGRPGGSRTIANTPEGWATALQWARGQGSVGSYGDGPLG